MIKSADRTMSNQFSVFIRNKKRLSFLRKRLLKITCLSSFADLIITEGDCSQYKILVHNEIIGCLMTVKCRIHHRSGHS